MATDPGTTFFSARQRRTVEAFADVFIEGAVEALSPAQIADNIDAQLLRIRSKRAGSLRLVLFGVEYLLPLASLRLKPFSRLDAPARRKLIGRHLSRAQGGTPLRHPAKPPALFPARYHDNPT